jgi:putative tryptophan/tyrosine transport system substrate-binding protein
VTTRRDLLGAMLASAALSLFAARVHAQPRPRRIGFLWEASESFHRSSLDAFRTGIRAFGYVEDKDYTLDHRYAQNDLGRLSSLAADLVAMKVDLIFASSTPAAVAAHKATRELPILFAQVSDPVGTGLAASLRQPGRNATGLTNLAFELDAKRLDLLRQVFPGLRRVGFFHNPDSAGSAVARARFESAAQKLQIKYIAAPARTEQEIADTFARLQSEKAQALVVTQGQWVLAWRDRIIEHAAKQRLPLVGGSSSYTVAGGLLSYAANTPDLYRRSAAYADKIFKGAKPGDLPIEQPNKFELMVNLKTARAVGLNVPQSLLVRADKVIE